MEWACGKILKQQKSISSEQQSKDMQICNLVLLLSTTMEMVCLWITEGQGSTTRWQLGKVM
jgi:hypothetical protein